uniref:Protein PIGBOS1 n=1 Tax=Denticeps clupeoides TaxID=299321 RepID=A0AAY4EI40_9TELE
MLRRRIPFHQIAFATLLGVAGGIYVYRPMFEPPRPNPESVVRPEDANAAAPSGGDQQK